MFVTATVVLCGHCTDGVRSASSRGFGSGVLFVRGSDESLKEYAHGMIDQGVQPKFYAPDVAPRKCLLQYLQPAHRVAKYACNLHIFELRLYIVAWQDSRKIQIITSSSCRCFSTSGSRWTTHASAGVWHTHGRSVVSYFLAVAATRTLSELYTACTSQHRCRRSFCLELTMLLYSIIMAETWSLYQAGSLFSFHTLASPAFVQINSVIPNPAIG